MIDEREPVKDTLVNGLEEVAIDGGRLERVPREVVVKVAHVAWITLQNTKSCSRRADYSAKHQNLLTSRGLLCKTPKVPHVARITLQNTD